MTGRDPPTTGHPHPHPKLQSTMRICYVLLSPTFGMHPYTANRRHKWLP